MTAINPAKLKVQAAALGELLEEPERFIPHLHDLLSFYGSRVRQTSLSSTPLTLQTYQVPAPVLRALQLEIKGQLESDPAPGYALTDHLWKESWVEFRQLAVRTLGSLPADDSEGILSRVRRWLDDCSSEDVRRLIMTTGLKGLAAESPSRCLDFIDELAADGEKASQQAALFGLSLFAENEDFLNLPLVYRTLSKILQREETGLVKEITALLRILISRLEQETAYFLIHQLSEVSQPRIGKITRQLVGKFSPDNQRLIKDKLGKVK